ncbi:MAG TPA: sulfotransferase [Solirubrobacteraceae bacterium]|nr:sulfotransferase [Solirubrobacteraceae bacterium]
MTGRDNHDAWAQEIPSEIAFWRHYLASRGDRWPEEFVERFDPESAFVGRFAEPAARLDGPVVRLLDVGAGPLTTVGKRLPGKELIVEACDPLAPGYDALLDELGLVPPVRTVACDGEKLLERYAPESFDVTHARNAIDHAYDPFAVIAGMLAVTRAGGFVALGHETNEAVRESYVGFHQWNFERDPAGAFLIWHPDGVVDVSGRLAPLATIEVLLTDDGGWADVIITRRPETAGLSPEAIAAAAGLTAGFDRPVVRVHRAGDPLPPAAGEAMLVASLDAGDVLPAGFDARHPAVGELVLARDAVALALPGGGRLVRAQELRSPRRASSRPCVVVVLGFHRSGTSMTTELLHRLGAHVGPLDGLLAADALDNPRGYWEPRRLIELNDQLLAALGGSAIDPPRLDAGWQRDPSLDMLRREAAAWLASTFGEAPVWALKDPRLCLTLPFWQELLAEHTDDVRYVLCLRSPVETAASLLRRPYDPPLAAAEWGEQWLAHIGAALAATRGAPRLLVAYDDLLREDAEEAARLADFAGLPRDRAASAAAIEPGLRHHTGSLVATAEDDGISAAARGAYLVLLAAARVRRAGEASALAEALEAMAVEHARAPRATAATEPPLRGALVDALGELQLADRSIEVLREQAEAHRRQATALQARLADAR